MITIRVPGALARALDTFTADDRTGLDAPRRDLRRAWDRGTERPAGRGTVRVIELTAELAPFFADLVEVVTDLESAEGVAYPDRAAARAGRALLARLAADDITPGAGPYSADDSPEQTAPRTACARPPAGAPSSPPGARPAAA